MYGTLILRDVIADPGIIEVGSDMWEEIFGGQISQTEMVIAIIFTVIANIIGIVTTAMIFKKAGEKWWYALIPFVDNWTVFKITWGHGAYMFLMFIPIAGIIVFMVTMAKLGKAFGKNTGFTVGLIFLPPIFELILAFDKSEYVGIQT